MDYSDIAWPPTTRNIIGLAIVTFMSMLANAAGLGGGGILTPYIMIFFKLSIHECIPLANIFGLIATVTRFITNYKQKHPNPEKAKDGKLSIDYEVVMMTMPFMFLGTHLGVQLGNFLSEATLSIFLTTFLLIMSLMTGKKAIEIYKTEKNQLSAPEMTQDPPIVQHRVEVPESLKNNPGGSATNDSLIGDVVPSELAIIIDEEAKHFTWRRATITFTALFLLLVTSMILGSKYQPGLVETPYSYLALLGFALYALYQTQMNAKEVRRVHEIKKRCGYVYDPHDVVFSDTRQIVVLIIYSILAGILGGVVGTAGGVILGILFLEMGMLPVVVSSTNQYLALISTISVTIQFVYMGNINYPFALYLGVFVLAGSLLGIKQVNRIVKMTGRQSIIVISLTVVLVLAMITLPLKYIINH